MVLACPGTKGWVVVGYPSCRLCSVQLCLHCHSAVDTILLGGPGGCPLASCHCCYLGLNKDFLRTPVLPVVLGIWDTVGTRCCPIALPALALCPRGELGAKIRVPRALCITGGAVSSPAQGLSGPYTWGRLPLSSAPSLVWGDWCPAVCPSLHSSGPAVTLPPLHVPWDYALLPGSRPVPGPHVSGPGVSQEPRSGGQTGVLEGGERSHGPTHALCAVWGL